MLNPPLFCTSPRDHYQDYSFCILEGTKQSVKSFNFMYCIIIIRICNHAMHLETRVDTTYLHTTIKKKNQLNKGGCFIYKHRTGNSHFATNKAII